jgi:hypothetical protein
MAFRVIPLSQQARSADAPHTNITGDWFSVSAFFKSATDLEVYPRVSWVVGKEGHSCFLPLFPENIGTPYRRPKATHDTSNTKKK